jgi:hypothetical protein
MVYCCEDDLRPNLVVEIIEYATIEVLSVVDCDLLWNSVVIDDILPEEFLDCRRGYIGDMLRLDPLGEIFRYHDGEDIVSLSRREFMTRISTRITTSQGLGRLKEESVTTWPTIHKILEDHDVLLKA